MLPIQPDKAVPESRGGRQQKPLQWKGVRGEQGETKTGSTNDLRVAPDRATIFKGRCSPAVVTARARQPINSTGRAACSTIHADHSPSQV